MPLKTTLEQLEEIQTALTAVRLGAQSYMMGDIKVTKANQKHLQDEEKRLLAKYYRETGKSPGRIRLNLSGGV